MNSSFVRQDPGLAMVLSFSTILHAAFFTLLSLTHFAVDSANTEQVYYVDMVNLPTAQPQSGNPAAAATTAPPPAPSTQSAEMKLPSAAKKAVTKISPILSSPKKSANTPAATETSSEFEERIARLERETAERRHTAALDALRQKVAAGTDRAGIPNGAGKEAGSDYASYIQSRLYEAFKLPKALQIKNNEVLVQLTINRTGRLSEYRIERSSGDKAFEDAVARAIANAERNFRPPPSNEIFRHNYVFKPDSVGKK